MGKFFVKQGNAIPFFESTFSPEVIKGIRNGLRKNLLGQIAEKGPEVTNTLSFKLLNNVRANVKHMEDPIAHKEKLKNGIKQIFNNLKSNYRNL